MTAVDRGMSPATHHLSAAGTSVLIEFRQGGAARIIHWGASLGDPPLATPALNAAIEPPVLQSGADVAPSFGLLYEHAAGYLGRPAIAGHRSGRDWSPCFVLQSCEVKSGSMELVLADGDCGLELRGTISLSHHGVMSLRYRLVNTGAVPYTVEDLALSLPLPAQACEILDFTGRWCGERHPQKLPLKPGIWMREGREGRPGHDFPLALVALDGLAGFRHGEAWAVSLAWSGNHRHLIERTPDGVTRIAAGELLLPGELVLAPGEEYAAPELLAVYSGAGLDGISDAFHAWLRDREDHPTKRAPRPVTINSWEAVYFDHDFERLAAMADTAAGIGVERFVLDDGWFRGRTDDRRGLGDWHADDVRWPKGLDPLIERVHGLGMEFGLWVEPEMVNPDSDLYRAHPEWVLSSGPRMPLSWRYQQALDLAQPAAFGFILERLDALLTNHRISFLKWDHNRPLIEASHAGQPGAHAQTLALYRLIDALRARHPGVEIESCASGGARIDLGMVRRTDRVALSDNLDPLDRQHIQRWTNLVVPPELCVTDIGAAKSHTTGRTHSLAFRALTALFGNAGLTLDLTKVSVEELEGLRQFVALHKKWRSLLHSGRVVRVDHPDPAALVHGVVAQDGSKALFSYVQLTSGRDSMPSPVRLAGLEASRSYRVRPLTIAKDALFLERQAPPWWESGVILPAPVLLTLGLRMPVLRPEQAVLLEIEVI